MKIYTKTGDGGQTSLYSGGRVSKDDPRVEAYGTVDELVSLVGLLLSEVSDVDLSQKLLPIQEALFTVGSVLADPDGRFVHNPSCWDLEVMESWIDEMESRLVALTTFILPGGCRAASVAHVARAVCRRAERRVSAIREDRAGVPDEILAYLNRLSDALFVLARHLNAEAGVAETPWRARADD